MGVTFTWNNITSSSLSVSALDIRRNILPPTRSITLDVPNRSGAYYFRNEYEANRIEIDVLIEGTSTSDLRTKTRDVADWLDTAIGIKALTFSDETDKQYQAVLSGETNMRDIIDFGRGTIVFFVPSAFAEKTTDQTEITSMGTLALEFVRTTIAYQEDAATDTAPLKLTQVASGVARFENLKYLKSIVIENEAGGDNKASDNQASVETDTTGFTVILGATITRVTDTAVHGSASLKVTTPGAATEEGVRTTNISTIGVADVTYSVYLRGSGTVKLRLNQLNSADTSLGITTGSTITLTSDFRRYSLIISPAAATIDHVRVEVITVSIQVATFWLDALQVETSKFPTRWQKPTDGTRGNEIVRMTNSGVLNAAAGTVECWVRFDSDTNTQSRTIFDSRDPASVTPNNTAFILFIESTKKLSILYGTGVGSVTLLGTTLIEVNTTHHVAATWDSGGVKIYLDGVQEASSATAPGFTFSAKSRIGMRFTEATLFLNGRIDDLRISNIARTAPQILATFNSTTPATIDSNTKGLYTMDGTLAASNFVRVGTAPSLPVMTIDFNASATNPYTIKHIESGDLIRVNKTFAPGDQLVIDSKKNLIKINGSSGMSNLDVTSDFFEISEGVNTFEFNQGQKGTVTLTYTPRFL